MYQQPCLKELKEVAGTEHNKDDDYMCMYDKCNTERAQRGKLATASSPGQHSVSSTPFNSFEVVL